MTIVIIIAQLNPLVFPSAGEGFEFLCENNSSAANLPRFSCDKSSRCAMCYDAISLTALCCFQLQKLDLRWQIKHASLGADRSANLQSRWSRAGDSRYGARQKRWCASFTERPGGGHRDDSNITLDPSRAGEPSDIGKFWK